MGQKDIAEKQLAEYNDVFADIVNGLLFEGEEIIKPAELKTAQPISQYKAESGKLHEQERDLAKIWSKAELKIAMFGLENQSLVDEKMPFRVIGYDGASYRAQLLEKKKEIAPVVTLVLYFGTEKRWDKPKSIKELMEIPEYLEPYVNDYRIHVFEIAWLTDEEIGRFRSDFRVVARFFANKRKNPGYMLTDPTEIRHVDEVLKLLSVITEDSRYVESLRIGERRIASMCDVAERLEQKGKAEGRREGRAEGRAEGRREGRAEGRREGRAEGRREGRTEERAEMSVRLYEDGMSLEKISRITNEPAETIQAWIAAAGSVEKRDR